MDGVCRKKKQKPYVGGVDFLLAMIAAAILIYITRNLHKNSSFLLSVSSILLFVRYILELGRYREYSIPNEELEELRERIRQEKARRQ